MPKMSIRNKLFDSYDSCLYLYLYQELVYALLRFSFVSFSESITQVNNVYFPTLYEFFKRLQSSSNTHYSPCTTL
jgi:hypothetical protein